MEVNYLKKPIQNLKQKRSQLPKIIGELIIINSPNILRQVRKRWLIGESVFGGFIGEYSSSKIGQDYKAYKMSINPSAKGHVDLTLTGALGDGLTIKKATQTSFEIFSTDEKYEKIGNKYGFAEFGLSDSEWLEMEDEIIAFVLESIINESYE